MDVPALMPVSRPVPASIVAFAVLLLLQVPPPVVLARLVVAPIQILKLPVMASGAALTVTSVVL
jgi:hypothetical protein